MKDLLGAIEALLEQLDIDENSGGLLSRTSLRRASEVRLELHRVRREAARVEESAAIAEGEGK